THERPAMQERRIVFRQSEKEIVVESEPEPLIKESDAFDNIPPEKCRLIVDLRTGIILDPLPERHRKKEVEDIVVFIHIDDVTINDIGIWIFCRRFGQAA